MEDWKKLLHSAVAERWRPGECFLIAQVKPFLKSHGVDTDKLLAGQQLRMFLEKETPDLGQIFNEQQPTNWGLVPKGKTAERPWAQYFIGKGRKSAVSAEFPYQNAMRVAFGKTIAEEMKRFVLHSPARFVDVFKDEIVEDGVQVTVDDLAVGASDDRIAARIAAWIGRNALSASDYQNVKSAASRSGKPQSTALHDLIDLLPAADLDRVSLPMDIIRKLLAKPGSNLK